MSLQLRWVGQDEMDRVAQMRMRCFAHAAKDLDRYREIIRADVRAQPEDFLLAEREGEAVGTATALSMTMWVREGAVPCQGVAWVGTIKTHRRRTEGQDGIATRVMRETLRMARERGQVVSALMPFRASFYEHFGYGLVERRNDWTIPLAILPKGDAGGIRFYRQDDLTELVRFRQRVVERGQCDIERPRNAWEYALGLAEKGFVVVDRPEADGPVRGYLFFEHATVGNLDHLKVTQIAYEDIAALKRQLHFLASLRDQYAAAVITLPVDVPLNWLLRETQIPHRLVNHPAADLRQYTRMQLRVLDHKRLIEAMKFPSHMAGRVVVAVQEIEGHESRFAIEFSAGKAQVSASSAAPGLDCPDRIWAPIVCGELPATQAVELGLAAGDEKAAQLLGIFSIGPTPFTTEYF